MAWVGRLRPALCPPRPLRPLRLRACAPAHLRTFAPSHLRAFAPPRIPRSAGNASRRRAVSSGGGIPYHAHSATRFFESDAMTEAEPIRLEQFVARPPAQVWAALTTPAALARWWAAGDVRPVPGHRFTLDMGPWGRQPCEVIAVKPERRFAIAFAQRTLDTTITWRLEPAPGGTRVCFEHAGFDLDAPQARIAYDGMKRGWPSVLARIEQAIDG